MTSKKGKVLAGGIAAGKIKIYSRAKGRVSRKEITDIAGEKARYEAAREKALKQFGEIYEKALREAGEESAAVFQAYQMILQDEEFHEAIKRKIETERVNAEYAVARIGDSLSERFAQMEDAYFRSRATDIRDISESVTAILMGVESAEPLTEPVILLAEELSPGETAQMDREHLLALVTRLGASNSHTAILARNRGIPALTDIEIAADWDGKQGIVDGSRGLLILDPDEKTWAEYAARLREQTEEEALLGAFKGREDVTLDGKQIKLYANIGSVRDVDDALQYDARGIGLFRSEYLYLETGGFPTEEQQFEAYKAAVQKMAGRKVIIRTLDLGADKQAAYLHLEKEENPALGCRAIRICLKRPDLFKTQLRALLRASAFGDMAILYPMIISEKEVMQIRALVEECKAELRAEHLPFQEKTEQGIMIETPAAAMISDRLAQLVDFFSIGTNDLTQYTLAVDRQNAGLEDIVDTHHEAVLRLIELVCRNAQEAGIRVGICGELASDLTLTERFIRMGIDELSVSPGRILSVRKKIRESKAEP